MRISDWSSDVCSSDLSCVTMAAAGVDVAKAEVKGKEVTTAEVRARGRREERMDESVMASALEAELGRRSARIASEIGRASGRERVCKEVEITVVAGSLKKKKNENKHRRGRDR